jgi:hypothetical protein
VFRVPVSRNHRALQDLHLGTEVVCDRQPHGARSADQV